MFNDFFKPLKEPLEKGREFLFFWLFLMVVGYIIRYFTHKAAVGTGIWVKQPSYPSTCPSDYSKNRKNNH